MSYPKSKHEKATAEEAKVVIDSLLEKSGLPAHQAPDEMSNSVNDRAEMAFGNTPGRIYTFIRAKGSDCKHPMHPHLPPGEKPSHTVVIMCREGLDQACQGLGMPCYPPWNGATCLEACTSMCNAGYKYVAPNDAFDEK
jgi:hypothetical protein